MSFLVPNSYKDNFDTLCATGTVIVVTRIERVNVRSADPSV